MYSSFVFVCSPLDYFPIMSCELLMKHGFNVSKADRSVNYGVWLASIITQGKLNDGWDIERTCLNEMEIDYVQRDD